MRRQDSDSDHENVSHNTSYDSAQDPLAPSARDNFI